MQQRLPPPWKIIFGSQPLAVPLQGSAADAVALLRGSVDSSLLPGGRTPRLVGSVSEDRVSVRFGRPWSQDGLAPVFVGGFTVIRGRRVLAGGMRLTRFAQVWLGAWFGFLLLMSLVTIIAVLLGKAEPGMAPGLLVLLSMWAVGLGVVYFAWWRGGEHRTEIERRLREALS